MYTFKSEKELENIIRIDKSIPNKVIENAKYHIGLVEESIVLHFHSAIHNVSVATS